MELIRSIDDARDGYSHGLEQGEDSVVLSIDCSESSLNGALSTTDGVTCVPVPYDVSTAALSGRHPLGFFWKSTWPWGPPDDEQGPTAILVSEDGATWTTLVRRHGPVLETPNGLVITQLDEQGEIAEDLVVYDGKGLSTVQADWPVDGWPEFLGGIGNTLIVIDGADVWVGEVFED